MSSPFRFALFAAAAVLLWPAGAFAHLTGQVPAHGEFLAGFSHPLGGFDHILAMGAVGLLASIGGGPRLWLYPASFVAAMVAGFALAGAGIALPWVEFGIAASLVVLGLAVVLGGRIPALAVTALIALCAVLHGHAHGSGAAGLANPFVYAGGFALSTAFLHAGGIGLGFALRRPRLTSAAGYGVAAAGALLIAGL